MTTRIWTRFLCILSAGCSLSLNTLAQSHKIVAFPDSSTVWFQMATSSDGSNYPISFDTYVYQLRLPATQMDTLANTIRYKKVYFSDLANPSVYYAAYREDTATHRVYVLERDSVTEKLMYDFSIHQPGDTLRHLYQPQLLLEGFGGPGIPITSFYQDLVVTMVDSIYFNKQYHRQYHFSIVSSTISQSPFPFYYTEVGWLEGYGGTAGLFQSSDNYMAGSVDFMLNLGCIVQRRTVVFPDSAAYSCEALGVIEKSLPGNSFRISPNPFQDHIRISSTGSYMNHVPFHMTNSRGETVYQGLLTGSSADINTLTFPPGMYFLIFGNGYRTEKAIKYR